MTIGVDNINISFIAVGKWQLATYKINYSYYLTKRGCSEIGAPSLKI